VNPQLRILVVDDDQAMLRMIRLTLVSEGYAVTTATDGYDGLHQLARQDFDLVVLDLQMPNMDGRTMHSEMKRLGNTTPVIVVSAYQAETARIELGAAGAVNKPFDTAVLIERIRSILPSTPETLTP
jgi:DNA-binding response OmpR family regulator